MRENWIREAVGILASHKGQLGVINMLRSYGMNIDASKKASFDIFDESKKRLIAAQRPKRFLAYCLMLSGILIPIGMLFTGLGIYIFSFTPLILGFVWLTKLPNPRRLPENIISEQDAPDRHLAAQQSDFQIN